MGKRKNYFNEKDFREKIKRYQDTCVVEGKVVIIKDELLERNLMESIKKIVCAVIYKYGYWEHEGEEVDDLEQHAMENCYKKLTSFNPINGTAFNYFTKIARVSLLNYTLRREKHRNQVDVEEELDLESRTENNFNFFYRNSRG